MWFDWLNDSRVNLLQIKFISYLEDLIVDCNKIQQLLDALRLKLLNLQKISVHCNNLFYLPSSILQVMSLHVLDVHKNKLRFLPEYIEKLASLQILNASYNYD